MSLPRTKTAQKYYRVAKQRYEDAEFLAGEKVERYGGAIYLAGYAVECILKALILSQRPEREHPEIVAAFLKGEGHNFGALKKQYLDSGGASFNRQRSVVAAFQEVEPWRVALRYEPGTPRADDVQAFLQATNTILEWADGRL